MANSKKSSTNEIVQHVAGILKSRLRDGSRIAVGLSGGIDSVVLLDVLAALSAPLNFSLSALHVNHQLSPNAEAWAAFCAMLCAEHRIPCRIEPVCVAIENGIGVEAAARAERYAVYARNQGDFIALAHHLDDQAETFMLQLLRGAGVKGLSAMPLARKLDGGPTLLRPLLGIARAEIERYAQARHLRWIEDESNADVGFDRNFLRHEIFPPLAARFPAVAATVSRAASHLAEAGHLLDQLAALDAAGSMRDASLPLAALRALDTVRGKNLLRYFLAQHGVAMPSSARLEEALRQMLAAADDAQPGIDLGHYELHRHHDTLYLSAKLPAFAAPISWQGEEIVEFPHGALLMRRTEGSGLNLARLASAPVTLRPRQGGEKLRPDQRRPRRTLKNLLQEAHIPPWQRDAMPLLFCGDMLAWVPGIGADCAYRAQSGEPSVLPLWQPYSQLHSQPRAQP